MAQSITLLGATYNDVPSVLLPKTGGGTAQFDDTTIASNAASASDIASGKLAYVNGVLVTGTSSGGGGGSYPWFGPNTIKDYTKTITINLKNDTSWDSWTASTTSSSILAAPTTNDFSYSFDRSLYDITIVTQVVTNYVYVSNPTKKNLPISTGRLDVWWYHGYPDTYDDAQNYTVSNGAYISYALSRHYYYSTSSPKKSVSSSNYGAYAYASPSYGTSSSGNTVTVGYKRPSIYARCSNTQFATGRKGDIDSEETNIVITVDIYKTPRNNYSTTVLFNEMFANMNASPENT